MPVPERRQAPNAELRRKIDQIQIANQRLKDAATKLESQLLKLVRNGDLKALPDPQLTHKGVEELLHEQKRTMQTIKENMMGHQEKAPSLSQGPLISAEEMAALMSTKF